MFLEPCLGNCSWIRCLTLVYLNLAWEPVLGSLAWEPVLGSLFLGTCSWEHCLITCSWELCLGNLFLETLPACFKPVHWDLAREPVFRNFAWEPCLGTCPSEPCLGFCSCFQPCLQLFFDILWNFAVQVVLPGNMSNLFLRTLLGNLFVEPFLQHCFGTFLDNLARQTYYSKPMLAKLWLKALLRNLALKPCLGTCSWEPCWQPIAQNLPREFVLGTRTCSCKACL